VRGPTALPLRWRFLCAALLGILAGSRAGLLADPDRRWTPIGPDGGAAVTALVQDPVTGFLYAGTSRGGVFVSFDRAGRWTPINDGLGDLSVRSLAVAGGANSFLYAGTLKTGVFRRPLAGGAWAAASNGLPSGASVGALTLDPGNPFTIYAATGFEIVGDGVFKSIDGGASWRAINSGLTKLSIQALAIDPGNPSRLWAGTANGGVFRTEDAGGSWTAAKNGLPSLNIQTLLASGSPAAFFASPAFSGLFKSVDGGRSWSAVNSGFRFATTVNAIAADSRVPQRLYASVGSVIYRSDDGAGSWTSLVELMANALVFDSSSPDVLLAATTAGVWKSVDAGATWRQSSAGLAGLVVTSVAAHPTNPDILYVTLSRSTDRGQTWVPSVAATALAVSPAAPDRVYAGTGGSGVFRSDDAGTTWT